MTIKLNKNNQEKEKILQLIKQSVLNQNNELECVIGGNFNLGSSITHTQFKKIISRINGKSLFVTKRPVDNLRISFPLDTKFKNIRVSINGYNAIHHYCLHESVDKILQYVKFETKTIQKKGSLNRLNILNYNIKFKQSEEIDLDIDSGIVRELLSRWTDLPKIYRYKKTYSYQTQDKLFSIDCSIVRDSSFADREITVSEVLKQGLINNVIKPESIKLPFNDWWSEISRNKSALVKARDLHIFYKNIDDSGVFTKDFTYEVEVEFIGNKQKFIDPQNPNSLDKLSTKQIYLNTKDKDAYIKSIFSGFFKYIGIILQCIQNSFNIISNTEVLNTLAEYKKLTNTKNSIYFGPLSVDLEKKHLVKLHNEMYMDMDIIYNNGNILLDYAVSEKIDGITNVLYISSNGRVYLVPREGNSLFTYTGMTIPEYANSIFYVEYVEYDINKKFLNKAYIIDAFFIKGKNIMRLPFGNGKILESRYTFIEKFTEKIKKGDGVLLDNEKLPFRIDKVSYLFGESSDTEESKRKYNKILENATSLLDKMNVKYGGKLKEGHLYSYETDGLVFMPTMLGVYQLNMESEVPEHVLLSNRKWSNCFKWKPDSDLSIDFKIEFVLDGKERSYVHYGTTKYVRANLLTRNYDSNETTFTMYNNNSNNKSIDKVEFDASSLLLNNNRSLKADPEYTRFIALYPVVGRRNLNGELDILTYECLIPVNDDNEARCHNGEIIYDGQTVEFAYDLNKIVDNFAMRWQPKRVRHNKSPNAYNIALNIWSVIHNPVSQDLFQNGYEYNEKTLKELDMLLEDADENTESLNKFQKFVNKYLIEKYLSNMSNPYVMDLGCHHMDEFLKYVEKGVHTLVGIDNNYNALNNKKNGAATKILNSMALSPVIKKLADRTMLLQLDMTRNFYDGDAAMNDVGQYYLDVMYGRYKPSPEYNKKHLKFYNVGVEGFNLITAFNSIQYCLDGEDTINNFFENINQNLANQGYFVGTCLDGNIILSNILADKNQEYKSEKDNDGLWSFKLFDDFGNILDNELMQVGNYLSSYESKKTQLLGAGNKVLYHYETQRLAHPVGLVDINYIGKIANRNNLKLVETRLAVEEPGDLFKEWINYNTSNNELVKEIKEKEYLNNYSKLIRYFVFQKQSRDNNNSGIINNRNHFTARSNQQSNLTNDQNIQSNSIDTLTIKDSRLDNQSDVNNEILDENLLEEE
jgi:hypothetical protein